MTWWSSRHRREATGRLIATWAQQPHLPMIDGGIMRWLLQRRAGAAGDSGALNLWFDAVFSWGSQMRSGDEIIELIEAAFRPLRCVVEYHSWGEKVSFRVFVGAKAILTKENIPMHLLQDDAGLRQIIEAARDELKQQRYTLDPWKFPD